MANTIEFLHVSMKLKKAKNSQPTVKFTRMINSVFDILNFRSPQAKGYKQPLKRKLEDTWVSCEENLKSRMDMT